MIAKLRVGEPSEGLNGDEEIELAVPVAIPEIDEIKKLAFALHAKGEAYEAELWGWPVSYDPGSSERPIDSKLTFTPALFFVGVWPIWYVSLTWEHGHNAEPSMLVGDEHIVQRAIPAAIPSQP